MMIKDSNITLYNDGQFPKIRVNVRAGEQRVYDVDDRRKTMKKVQEMINGYDGDDKDEKILEVVLGKKAAKEICESDISTAHFNELVTDIMSIITGESVENLKGGVKN